MMDIAKTDEERRPAVDAATGTEPVKRKRQKTQHAVSDNMQVASNMTANLMLTPASRHQDTQQCALLRLPQELQDMIYAYVYGGRELKLRVKRDKGTRKYVFEDSEASNEYAKKGTLSVVPALAQTCQQLRWTSKLYFELNKLWIGQDFPLHFQDEGP
ncbi:hypothetical protein E8E13_005475 [Curvularia kusanoi]|uniref:Uncharacterized protein n=1 Tax=Curvularia kusanoi TaxID=90978 RepID=A0A9P4TAL2_CURKU|nr:hypothetical protein E8E13_005475 [Curvularia kusanoi]